MVSARAWFWFLSVYFLLTLFGTFSLDIAFCLRTRSDLLMHRALRASRGRMRKRVSGFSRCAYPPVRHQVLLSAAREQPFRETLGALSTWYAQHRSSVCAVDV